MLGERVTTELSQKENPDTFDKSKNVAKRGGNVAGTEHKNMLKWSMSVKSGDSDNLEARAAVYYWKSVFPRNPMFVRDYEEDGSNALLNYGYAILRAIVARGLVAGGLIPTLGIHHHNRYNAYCLADDIMEPYRSFVDKVVVDILDGDPNAIYWAFLLLRFVSMGSEVH